MGLFSNKYKLMEVSDKFITNEMIGSYLARLIDVRGLKELGFERITRRRNGRYIIYSPYPSEETKWYFLDRNPGIIEHEILSYYGMGLLDRYVWEFVDSVHTKNERYKAVINIIAILNREAEADDEKLALSKEQDIKHPYKHVEPNGTYF